MIFDCDISIMIGLFCGRKLEIQKRIQIEQDYECQSVEHAINIFM